MTNETQLAVILHADVVGSTMLVQTDERLAHERIRSAFLRLSKLAEGHGGKAHEIRGDALVAEFQRPSDALTAAMNFQREHQACLESMTDGVSPQVRIGIALGEVIIADGTLTGNGVIMAQRLEQLAQPGRVCISSAIRESLPGSLVFEYQDLGEQKLKGFDRAQRTYLVVENGLHEIPMSVRPAAAGETSFLGTSVVILPFENKGNDPDGEFLADGLTEDITTAMSVVRWLMVIARASAVVTAGHTKDIQQVGSELNVEYVVTGTVRKAHKRIRVTADLSDVQNRRQIWSKRYDRVVEDIFDVQDDLARSIASELAPEITKAGLELITRTPPGNLNAWETYQRGVAAMFQRSKESLEQARSYFEAAIQHDPRFASPYASLGLVHWRQILWRMIPPEEVSKGVDTMFALAAQALALDPRESVASVVRGLAYLLRSQFDLALREMDSALSVNPSSALALVMRGSVHTCSHGDNEQAIKDLELAERLSPTDPLSRSQRLSALAYAAYQLGKYRESARHGEEAFRCGARYGAAYGIAACIDGGDPDEAQRRVADLRAQDPDLTIRFLQRATSFIPEDDVSKRFYNALEQAGLPVG